MPEDPRAVITAQIAEMEAGLAALRTAYARAFGDAAPAPRFPELVDREPEVFTPRRRRKGAPAPAARLGSREREVLDALRHNPDGLTIPELAAAMDSDEKYLYRALPRLLARGHVRTDTVPAGTELGEDRAALGRSPRWHLAGKEAAGDAAA